MKLKTKLLALFGGLFFLTIFSLSMFSFVQFSAESTSNYYDKLEQQSFLISNALEQRMSQNLKVLKTVAATMEITEKGPKNEAQLMQSLDAILANMEVINAYLAVSSGITYSTSNAGVVPNFNAKDLQREWFVRLFAGDDFIITKPYTSAEGDTVMALGVPVMRNGRVVAALVTNLNVGKITAFVASLSAQNQIYVTRNDGFVLAAQSTEQLGQNIFDLQPSYKDLPTSTAGQLSYVLDGEQFYVSSHPLTQLGWTVWAWEYIDNIKDASESNLISSLVLAILALGVSLVVLYFFIIKFIYLPLGAEPEAIQHKMQLIAAGDLRCNAEEAPSNSILAAAHTMAEKLHGMVASIDTIANQVDSNATNLEDSATSMKGITHQQMEHLDQTATAVNQMSITIDEVARNAQSAFNSVEEANQNANDGIAVVKRVDESINSLTLGIKDSQKIIQELDVESQRVSQIVDVIQAIAAQTNLLALNAAIEAARAGEQGRGFAVVADEVRSLASRTQDSTAQIQQLNESLQNKASEAVSLMDANSEESSKIIEFSASASQSIQTIQSSISVIQNLNSQIATAAEEQSVVAKEIAVSVEKINAMSVDASEGSNVNAKLSEALKATASQLKQRLQGFLLG